MSICKDNKKLEIGFFKLNNNIVSCIFLHKKKYKFYNKYVKENYMHISPCYCNKVKVFGIFDLDGNINCSFIKTNIFKNNIKINTIINLEINNIEIFQNFLLAKDSYEINEIKYVFFSNGVINKFIVRNVTFHNNCMYNHTLDISKSCYTVFINKYFNTDPIYIHYSDKICFHNNYYHYIRYSKENNVKIIDYYYCYNSNTLNSIPSETLKQLIKIFPESEYFYQNIHKFNMIIFESLKDVSTSVINNLKTFKKY